MNQSEYALNRPYFKLAGSSARRYMLVLLLALAALLAAFKPANNGGDFVEYTLLTSAIATHGTPDVRLSDIADLKRMLPENAWVYEFLEKDMLAGQREVYAAFVRGREDKVYAVHFFGYPLLAAVPFKLMQLTGLPPFKCFQVLNLFTVFILGLALFRLYGSAWKAGAGIALFFACGGLLYWRWSSPECMSAAALLAGLLFYATGAQLRGGLLGGLASLQNPTILFFFGFAPLFKLIIDYQPGIGVLANLRRQLSTRAVLGMGLGLLLVALPPLFNLYQFGVPNIIVKKFSDAKLISLTRLASFFFDLNQGMVIAIPGVALAIIGLRAPERSHSKWMLAAAVLLVLALAVPALAVLNWNSGAVGIMRYVSWASMPVVFVLLWRLSLLDRWPRRLVLLAGALQLLCMAQAMSYSYVDFSPLAKLMLHYAPNYYHPEPEIFAERNGKNDSYINPAEVYVYRQDGKTVKSLYNLARPDLDRALCGPGMLLARHNRIVNSTRNWRYLDGEPRCVDDGRRQPLMLGVEDMRGARVLRLDTGWSDPAPGGGIWDGAWSIGDSSALTVALPQRQIRRLTLMGHYAPKNTRTRVQVNGIDMGWIALDKTNVLELPEGLAHDGRLHIALGHEAPRAPSDGDPRPLAYFLQSVTVQ